jgi:hypothetical protein
VALALAVTLVSRTVGAAPQDTPPEPAADDEPDHSDAWDSPDSGPSGAAPPQPAPPPAEPAPVDSEPSPEAEEIDEKLRAAKGLAIGGYVTLGVGAGTLVLVSVPFWIASGVAKSRAEGTNIFITEEELLERAERRMRVANISALAGGSVLVVGIVLVAAGLGWKASLRSQKRDLAVAPMLGPTKGLQVQFRF